MKNVNFDKFKRFLINLLILTHERDIYGAKNKKKKPKIVNQSLILTNHVL